MLTVAELMKVARVTRSTIADWQARGLIPAPMLAKSKSGRGRTGYWTDDTVDTVQYIRALQDRGLSLDAIAENVNARQRITLGQVSPKVAVVLRQLDVPLAPPSEDYPVPLTHRREFRNNLAVVISKMTATDRAIAIADRATRDDCLGWALELAYVGYGPVLCAMPSLPSASVDSVEDQVFVTTDFLVGHQLGLVSYGNALREARKEESNPLAAMMELLEGCYTLPLYWRLFQLVERVGQPLPNIAPVALATPRLTFLKPDGDVTIDYTFVTINQGPFGRLLFSHLSSTAQTSGLKTPSTNGHSKRPPRKRVRTKRVATR